MDTNCIKIHSIPYAHTHRSRREGDDKTRTRTHNFRMQVMQDNNFQNVETEDRRHRAENNIP